MPGDVIDRTEVIGLLSELVRIPSVNPWMGDGSGEEKIALYLVDRIRSLGLTPTITEVQPGRPNVLVTVPGKPAGPHLLFEAHTDTVPPSHGQVEPFSSRIQGDRLYGRGSCDTKASVAAAFLALASVLPVQGRRASISLALTMGEELGHEGVGYLMASGFRADAAVVGEPTGLDVVVAHKGVVRWRMTALGRAVHSSTPGEGSNAIVKMAAVVQALEEILIPQFQQRTHPLLGSPTLSVGRIEGGIQVNVVPDRCTIEVDRRLLPGDTWMDIRQELEGLLASLREKDPELQVTLEEPYQNTPGMETPWDAAIVRIAQEAVRRIDGQRPVRGVAFGTDAAELSKAGIPCVVLGPGDISQAHTSDEYVEIQQVVKAAAIYREIMLTF
ncbi:MAG TPA: M20 family metallopeptidase [Candidatus Methylomirabilis sp.]|nr:M20 family metallopeptidase [Candidatus Methylomirabilis sp.]